MLRLLFAGKLLTMPIFKTRLSVSPQLYLTGAIVLLIFPIHWILAWIAAVIIHELFHYFVLRICNTEIISINLGINGARMTTGPLTARTELACALAGPAGSLSLLLLARWFPYVAICGLFHAVYNLLPLFPLDGGRVAVCLIRMIVKGRSAIHIYRLVKVSVFVVILMLSMKTLQYNLGPIPILLTIMLFFRTGMENPLANIDK